MKLRHAPTNPPNEMTREGIFGLEHKSAKTWAQHNTTIPFTRLLAGHADYTPVIFGERRKETSWAHQIASAANGVMRSSGRTLRQAAWAARRCLISTGCATWMTRARVATL